MNWPTFFTRLGSAIVFAAVMMCGLLWKDWMFVMLVGAIMVLCLREYFRLIGLINGEAFDNWFVLGVQAFGLIFSLCSLKQTWLYWILPICILLVAVLSKSNIRRNAFQVLGSLLYVILPCALLVGMHRFELHLPLILILCIWMNDTMAYIVGSFIGKTPFSKISPKKTWEGTIGGALLTVIGAAVAAHFIPNQSMPLYIALALCAAIAGTAGDLFESKLKRIAGVKDSGTLMPGHGGALDRFDSLLVATPFAFCAVYLVQAFYR